VQAKRIGEPGQIVVSQCLIAVLCKQPLWPHIRVRCGAPTIVPGGGVFPAQGTQGR
jgi:hypothetical protein